MTMNLPVGYKVLQEFFLLLHRKRLPPALSSGAESIYNSAPGVTIFVWCQLLDFHFKGMQSIDR